VGKAFLTDLPHIFAPQTSPKIALSAIESGVIGRPLVSGPPEFDE
jgi:hypothetical protein